MENKRKMLLDSVRDDLNITLEEILLNEKPSRESLDQLEYDLDKLKKLIVTMQDLDESQEINNILQTVEKVLNAYTQGQETTSPIRIKRSTKQRIHKLGTVKDNYDTVIVRLLDFYEENKED